VPSWLFAVLFVVAILTIVLIHEAGHFVTAKAFKIKVEEFFVGFGPRLWSFRRGETEYGVKALPLGGYVRIAGMNPFQEIPPEELPRTFGAKPAWQRAVVIGAGPVTHFLMAILLLAGYFMFVGQPSLFRPVVEGVEATLNGHPSPAAAAGLRPGDQIIGVDGQSLPASRDPAAAESRIISYTRAHVGQPVKLTVRRGSRTVTLTVTPELADVDGKKVGRLGVILSFATVARDRLNPVAAVGRGGTVTWQYTTAVVAQLGHVFGPSGLRRIADLIAGRGTRTTGDVTSLVGAGRLAVEAAKAGAWEQLLGLLVSFNVFIGILNLVPLPPFDGGHLAVIVYEKVRRRRPDIRKLIPLTAVVAAFMILFAVAVMYLDIVHPLPNPFQGVP
jgi:membrane-associated protease RseP (regulator of RpoE activity)